MHANQKAGEPGCAHALRGKFECTMPKVFRGVTLRTFQPNGKKEPRHRLKLVNAPAKKRSIGLEKNKVARLRNGPDKMRNARVMQRLASPNPNNRRAAGINLANSFVRNGMTGIMVQNFCRIHKLNGAGSSGKSCLWREPGHRQVCCEPQRKLHHAL